MKWVLLLFSLVFLFAANNALFWVPGNYDWFNFTFAGSAIVLAAVFAWLSSRKFSNGMRGPEYSWKNVVLSPPSVIWFLVILMFCFGGALKILAFLFRH